MNKLVKDTLIPTNVPVSLLVHEDNAPTYITYFFYNEMGVLYAEDAEDKTRYSLQVDIWSKGNYIKLAKQVYQLMIDAGFTRITARDFYEEDTETYHKVFRFYYTPLGG